MAKVVVVIKKGIPEIIQNGSVEVEVIDLDNIKDGYDDSWDSTKIAHFKNWAKGLPKEEIDDLVEHLTRIAKEDLTRNPFKELKDER